MSEPTTAVLADEAAVPQSGRVHWYSPARDKVEQPLTAEIELVRPRRARGRK